MTNQDVIYHSLLSLAFPAIATNSNGSALLTFSYSSNFYDENGIPTNSADTLFEYPGAPRAAQLLSALWAHGGQLAGRAPPQLDRHSSPPVCLPGSGCTVRPPCAHIGHPSKHATWPTHPPPKA